MSIISFIYKILFQNKHKKSWQTIVYQLEIMYLKFYGGGNRIRTGDKGFADLCLTTWLCRHQYTI